MKRRALICTDPTVLALLSLLAGCGGSEDPAAPDAGPSTDSSLPGAPDAGSPSCMGGSPDAGSAGVNGSIPATFDTVKLVVGGGGGIMTCAAAPCHGVHGAAPPDHPLELPSNNDQLLYANLMSYVSKACNNAKLVDPCNPSKSALVRILKGPCGATPRMPFGCTAQAGDCIPDEYIAAVERWIAAGAPRP